MNAGMQVVGEIVDDLQAWIKGLVGQAEGIVDAAGAEGLERSVRQQGMAFLGRLLERLLQQALEHRESRCCPRCGGRRRHKGVRWRGVVSSVGHLRLKGPYWYCRDCREGRHALDALCPQSVSGVMRELICLLGTSLGSFAKAQRACDKLLGVKLDPDTIRQWCLREGQGAMAHPPAPPVVAEKTDLTGSCDGTMVNTREGGWRELKAYRFEHSGGRHGLAALETAEAFLPRIRKAATAMKAWQAGRLFWVSDAAEWIDKGIELQLPMAKRIVDLWHARQHIYDAGRKIFGEGTAQAQSWSRHYSEELRHDGGRVVWNSLRRVRYADVARQEALEALLNYLDRQADRLDYPTYERAGYPISSGSMESFCKQLGQRLKGPGMRWTTANVDPMAALVSLWALEEWDAHWHHVA
jgi:hypothetical protein